MQSGVPVKRGSRRKIAALHGISIKNKRNLIVNWMRPTIRSADHPRPPYALYSKRNDCITSSINQKIFRDKRLACSRLDSHLDVVGSGAVRAELARRPTHLVIGCVWRSAERPLRVPHRGQAAFTIRLSAMRSDPIAVGRQVFHLRRMERARGACDSGRRTGQTSTLDSTHR